MGRFGFELVPVGDYYTFSSLEEAPRFSLSGGEFMGVVANKNFEGEPWEVFEANALIYDFSQDLVKPISTIVEKTEIAIAGNKFVSPGLILPGSITDGGSRVRDYSAWYSRDTLRFLYSEVGYV
jgi:hypothetical protein